MRRALRLWPALFLFLLGGCTAAGSAVTGGADAAAAGPAAAGDRVFAYVNDQPVYAAELAAELDKLPYYYQLQLAEQPDQRRKFVDNYLTTRLMLTEAQALHLDDAETFAQRLASVRRELLLESYTQYLVAMVALPDDSAVERYYRENPDEFHRPAGARYAYILVQDRTTADRLAAQLRQGAGFDALQAQESQATDTVVFLADAQVAREPDLKAALGALAVGAVSAPFSRDENGWYLFRKLETVAAGAVPLAECRDQVRLAAHRQTVSLFVTAYVERLKREHPFRIVGEQ